MGRRALSLTMTQMFAHGPSHRHICRKQKHFTVFVGRLTPEQKAAWRPALNEEHSAWRWFKLEEAQQRADLHPVAALALQTQPHRQAVVAAVLAGLS